MAPRSRGKTGESGRGLGGKSRDSSYELRWQEGGNPQLIPESWAENGRHEDIPANREPFYAFQVKSGLLLEYEVDSTGNPISGPHREDPAFRVLYITADGKQAILREFIAIENGTQAFKPPNDFPSIITPMNLDKVNPYPRPSEGKQAVADLYGNSDE